MSDRLPFQASPASPALPAGLVSNDETRERAIRLLTDAYAYDVITDVEFERRLGQLGLATTPAAVEFLVADLSVASTGLRTTLSGNSPAPLSEGSIFGCMSETRRKGPWRVPQLLSVRAIMCDMKLDLRYAAIPPGCTIHVTALMASVQFIVAPGIIVDFNVDPVMGAARSDADGGSMAGLGPAHLHMHGTAIMADVRVREKKYGK